MKHIHLIPTFSAALLLLAPACSDDEDTALDWSGATQRTVTGTLQYSEADQCWKITDTPEGSIDQTAVYYLWDYDATYSTDGQYEVEATGLCLPFGENDAQPAGMEKYYLNAQSLVVLD